MEISFHKHSDLQIRNTNFILVKWAEAKVVKQQQIAFLLFLAVCQIIVTTRHYVCF
jgi:hypothetical protein